MQCEEVERTLDSYVSGYLSEEPLREFESHIRQCPSCAERVKAAQRVLTETGNVFGAMLPESQVEDRILETVAGATMRYEKSWGEVMREQWERAPWWMISAAVHAVILMLMTIITVATAEKSQDDVVITTDLAKKKEPEYDENKVRDIFKNTKEVEADEIVENPVFVHEEVEVTDHFETENEMETNTARGQEDAISDIPLGGTGVVGNIGVGGGGAGCFGYRTGGGRKRAVGRFGGSKATESAVDAALRWLARHQEPDGHWDTSKHGPVHDGHPDAGMTGQALLAFLGAGHTERAGKFKTNVRSATKWIMDQQQANGSLHIKQRPWYWAYGHAICGLALAEGYGMARNPKVGEAAQKAVDYSVNEHQSEYSGWRYSPKSPADTSVSGWFIMQLKSAKVAGLKVEGKGFAGAAAWLDKVEDKGVYKGYSGGRFSYQEGREIGQIMVAAGMLGRLFMGTKPDELKGGGEQLLGRCPKWTSSNFYYWYYGTLVMFQMGGEYWKAWNPAMKDALLQNQRRGGDEDGSWDPGDQERSAHKNRVMSTALGALCLEVYYRYLPVHGKK